MLSVCRFVFIWADIAQCRILTHAIIKNFDVFEDTIFDFLKRVEFLPVYEFDFHTTEERLHCGVVPAVVPSAHAGHCTDAHYQVLVSHRAILNTSVGVND